jgi:hypothetical protein
MSQETIIEKIKKLLEINRANGATEAEEMAAMERANVLMTKYQIEKHQLRGGIKTKNIHIRQPITEWTHSIEQFHVRIGEFFGVLALHTKCDMSYYGNKDQAEMAMQTAKRAILSQDIGYTKYLCSDEYRIHRRTQNRRIIKLSFHEGFFDRLNARLDKMIEEREAETIHATGTNLVVLDAENLKSEYENDFGYHLNNGRNLKAKTVDYDSYIAGDKKGSEFVIVENNMIA